MDQITRLFGVSTKSAALVDLEREYSELVVRLRLGQASRAEVRQLKVVARTLEVIDPAFRALSRARGLTAEFIARFEDIRRGSR